MKLRIFFISLSVWSSVNAYAQAGPNLDSKGNDLTNCVWASGVPMSERQCAEARHARQLWLEHQKSQDDQKQAIQASRKWQADEEAKRKKSCGADFGKLRIGMTLDRYEECTEALDHVTQTVSQSGVTEVYRSTFYLIQARDGRIVSFTRR